MTSFLTILVVSAFAVSIAQGELSKHDSALKHEFAREIKPVVSDQCYYILEKYEDKASDDAAVDGLCNSLETTGLVKSLVTSLCNQTGYDAIKQLVCTKLNASNADRKDKLSTYADVYSKLDSACQAKTSAPNTLKTWYDFEQLCDKISTKNKTDYKKQCAFHYYYNLRTAACFGQNGHITLSKHDSTLKDDILTQIKNNITNKSCYFMMNTTLSQVTTDYDVQSLCDGVQADKKFIVSMCTRSMYDNIKTIVCDNVTPSNAARTKLVNKYGQLYPQLPKTCQAKSGDSKNLKTWYDLEQLCERVGTTDKFDFKMQCGDEYGDLKTAVCGESSAVSPGGASAVLSGLVTMGLCLFVAVFK